MRDAIPFILYGVVGVCVLMLTAYFTEWMQDEPGDFMLPIFGAPLWPILLVCVLASLANAAGERRRDRLKLIARQREQDEAAARRLLAKEGLDL